MHGKFVNKIPLFPLVKSPPCGRKKLLRLRLSLCQHINCPSILKAGGLVVKSLGPKITQERIVIFKWMDKCFIKWMDAWL